MKKHEITFSLLKIPLDFLVVFFAFFLAKEIRLVTDMIPGVYLPIQTLDTRALSLFALAGATLYIILFASHKLYSIQINHSKVQEISDIIRYTLYWFLFFSVGIYLGKGYIYEGKDLPRLIILFTALISLFGSISLRVCMNIFQSQLLKKGFISKRKLLLIQSSGKKKIQPILDDIKKSHIYEIVGYSDSIKNEKWADAYIGGFEKIEALISQRKIDEILFIESSFSKDELHKIWELSRIFNIRYRYITHQFDITKTNTNIGFIYEIPVIEILSTPLQSWNRVIKRFSDICLSLFFIIIFSPLMIFIAWSIKMEDPSGPVIYKNRRIGQNGSIFNCYKFRYLRWEYCIKESYGIKNQNDPAISLEEELKKSQNSRSGPLYKIENDPRKTKIGKILERYSLDELPQFFNVLKGDMSIIGPRPHQPREVEQYTLSHKRLLTIKPGITGMAQVHGREQNDFEKEAELDLFYIENWSFLLDMKILVRTLVTVLQRK